MPTEREARMSMVLIEARPTPINVSLPGMRHTAACHRNAAPQKQPYASRYAASHKHVFRRDVYQCLVFQASTCRGHWFRLMSCAHEQYVWTLRLSRVMILPRDTSFSSGGRAWH